MQRLGLCVIIDMDLNNIYQEGLEKICSRFACPLYFGGRGGVLTLPFSA